MWKAISFAPRLPIKERPVSFGIGSYVRSLAVMNAMWRRAWPDAHCRTVTIQLLLTVCVCVRLRACVIMSVHTGPHVQGKIRSRTSTLNTGKEYFSVIGSWTVIVCPFWLAAEPIILLWFPSHQGQGLVSDGRPGFLRRL